MVPRTVSRYRFIRILGLAGLLGIVAFATKRLLWPKRFQVVLPGALYRSGQIQPWLIKPILAHFRIEVILDLQGERPSSVRAREAELAAAHDMGVLYYSFSLEGDGSGSVDEYACALTVLHRSREAGKRVLVHCAAGTERTGALIAFYQLLFEKRPPERVWNELQKAGHRPSRNPHLRRFINQVIPTLSTRLKKKGILPEIPSPLPLLPTAHLSPSFAGHFAPCVAFASF